MIAYLEKNLGAAAESAKPMYNYDPGEGHPECPEKSATIGEER